MILKASSRTKLHKLMGLTGFHGGLENKSVNGLLRIAYCVLRNQKSLRNTQYEPTCYRNKAIKTGQVLKNQGLRLPKRVVVLESDRLFFSRIAYRGKPQVASCRLQVASYKLQVASCKLHYEKNRRGCGDCGGLPEKTWTILR